MTIHKSTLIFKEGLWAKEKKKKEEAKKEERWGEERERGGGYGLWGGHFIVLSTQV